MMRFHVNMVLGAFKFDFVNDVEVESSWEQFTDNCKILLPSNIKLNQEQSSAIGILTETMMGLNVKLDRFNVKDFIKPGDKVTVDVTYQDKTVRWFEGFITGIKPKVPIEIQCEDMMYSLKRNTITDTVPSASIKKIVDKHFQGMNVSYQDAELGKFRIDKLSQAKVLEKLREAHAIYSFFRKGVLTINKVYDKGTATTHLFKFNHNIIEDNLEYMRKEDMKLQVKAVSNYPDGSVKEERAGDPGGEERVLSFYNISKDALKKAAERELGRLKYDGYHGEFIAFADDVVFQGDIVELEHPQDSDKSGSYWVDKVVRTFGTNGARQRITLGPKL